MSTGIDCVVYIDGQRAADGHPTDDPLDPTVLSGLQIVWGRDTTVDQPAPSTCDFTVLDDYGGRSFVQQLRTGRRVDIHATGNTYPDPTVSTITDPGFDDTPAGQTPGNVHSTTSTATVGVLDGENALRVDPHDASAGQVVTIAPAPFSTLPNAWDSIPKLIAGQDWSISVDVWAYAGATIEVQLLAYEDSSGKSVKEFGTPLTADGTGAWQTLAASFTASAVSNVWVGVRVRIYPVGPEWIEMPAGQSWADTPGAWDQLALAWIDNVEVLAPESGVAQEILVYSGRITDLEAAYDDSADAPTVKVTCADFTADLDNVRVGDEPWAVEPMAARFNRVLTLAGIGVTAIIDPDVSVQPVTYQDVDSTAATGLLQDLAQSVDGVMWPATHITTGPYIHVEDTNARPALFVLDDSTGLVEIVPAADIPAGVDISACDVLRDPVAWIQNVADVATRTAVTWQEQGVDDEGKVTTTDRTYTIIDAGLEAAYGQRGISVSTLLAEEADAADIAKRILARSSVTGWRVNGLTIADPALETSGAAATELLLELLDGTTRNGLPMTLTELPPWSPVGPSVPGYLEGGTYSYVDGAWQLDLTMSRAATQGTSVDWDQLDPAWAWNDFDPAISWAGLYGVGPETQEVPA